MAVINKVGVVGLGTMGAGIVEVFAKQGINVVAVEINDEALGRGTAIIERSTARALERGKLTEADRAELLARIEWTTTWEHLADADLVVEAVPERMDIKRDLFQRLDAICKPETILASNTSSLSVTQIAAHTQRPDRVVGMHFFNPAPAMKLVEVIRTVLTDDSVVEAIHELSTRSGKTPVVIGDRAGFIANTLLVGYLNDAMRLFDESGISREDLDDAMRLGAGLPMGPLTLGDLIGLDVCLEIAEVLFSATRDPLHAPPALLREMVSAGLLGRKTGRGFYTYDKPGSGKVVDDAQTPQPAESSSLDGLTVGVVANHPFEVALVEAVESAGAKAIATNPSALEVVADADVVFVAAGPGTRVAEVAAALGDKRAAVVGVHVHRPSKAGRAVEITRTAVSSTQALAAARGLAVALEATPVIADDLVGGVVARLITPYLNDAARLLATGYAAPDDLDAAMMLGCGYPIGPIAFLDGIGSRPVVNTLDALHAESGASRHVAVPFLRESATLGLTAREMAAARS